VLLIFDILADYILFEVLLFLLLLPLLLVVDILRPTSHYAATSIKVQEELKSPADPTNITPPHPVALQYNS
jgi:hypothetical protein